MSLLECLPTVTPSFPPLLSVILRLVPFPTHGLLSRWLLPDAFIWVPNLLGTLLSTFYLYRLSSTKVALLFRRSPLPFPPIQSRSGLRCESAPAESHGLCPHCPRRLHALLLEHSRSPCPLCLYSSFFLSPLIFVCCRVHHPQRDWHARGGAVDLYVRQSPRRAQRGH